MFSELGVYDTAVSQRLAQLHEEGVVQRIWEKDFTVWGSSPDEISNRLGWLDSPKMMQQEVDNLQAFAAQVQSEGFTHVLLLGMGGSSLAPEVFAKTFGSSSEGLTLQVLDSTDPGAVAHFDATLDYAKTLFIVATKSGGTAETLSFFNFFYTKTAALLGEAEAGNHFVAITDPGSKLVTLAEKHSFRHTFLNDPNIGGRYAVLSFFGLVPAALVGLDVGLLLARAQTAVSHNHSMAHLGVTIGTLAQQGRDKLTFIISEQLASFGDWVEQLIAESTGKAGKGILPIVGESVGAPEVYGSDRVFVHLKLPHDTSHDEALMNLVYAGHPVLGFTLSDTYDMGAHFFYWEMATAIAGHVLGIQPFDQPNVESAKVQARKMIAAYQETGKLPEGKTDAPTADTLNTFLAQAGAGDYLSLHAYVTPSAQMDAALQTLRHQLRDRLKLATTMGYGPRFLHSTGQLHKGDGGHGLFVQLVAKTEPDVAIPDEAGQPKSAMSFDTLKEAQALGDAAALQGENRRLLRFKLFGDVVAQISQLSN